MFIHTVKAGDSLFNIGKRYNISVQQLRLVNGIGENLVPGQALLIPSYIYTVQPRDTLADIASKAYVSVAQLRAANPSINPTLLQPGMQIVIPDISNYLAGTLEFYEVQNPEKDQQIIRQFAPYSSSIAIFEYHFSSNGDITNDLNDLVAIETTWQNRVTPIVTITNITSEGFSSGLVSEVLNNLTARNNLVNSILNLVNRKGYGGVNIDFEQVAELDRDIFTTFLRELRDRLKRAGLILTIAMPPKTSDDLSWLRGYDYSGIGSVVDYMFIMAYNWHYPGSEAGPVAPISELRRTIEYAIQKVPRNKIILGLPLYGYDWVVPFTPEAPTPAISNQTAIERAMSYQVPVQYATTDESPYYRYTDSTGITHEVWFEDVRSMSAKMQLVRQYGLQAIGAWQLSLGFPPGVWLLRKFFTIRKI